MRAVDDDKRAVDHCSNKRLRQTEKMKQTETNTVLRQHLHDPRTVADVGRCATHKEVARRDVLEELNDDDVARRKAQCRRQRLQKNLTS